MIIESQPNEAKSLAQLHRTSGVAGILGKLSIKTLSLNFYLPLLLDRQIVKYSEIDVNQNIVGFIAFRKRAHEGKLHLPKKNTLLFVDLVFALLKSPKSVPIILNVLRTEEKVLQISELQQTSFGEIQILTVDKEFQSLGYGSDLLKKVLKDSDQPNILVKTQSARARDFYLRHGFVEIFISKLLGSTIFILLFSRGEAYGN
jgi:ribosomal protein S18 acetylase RimI-like enzyme